MNSLLSHPNSAAFIGLVLFLAFCTTFLLLVLHSAWKPRPSYPVVPATQPEPPESAWELARIIELKRMDDAVEEEEAEMDRMMGTIMGTDEARRGPGRPPKSRLPTDMCKCEGCGADVTFYENARVAECGYCLRPAKAPEHTDPYVPVGYDRKRYRLGDLDDDDDDEWDFELPPRTRPLVHRK